MARTKRFYPYHHIRFPKTFNYKKAEIKAFEAIVEAFNELNIQLPYSNRLQARAGIRNTDIPDCREDLGHACWGEIWKLKD